MHLFHKNKDTGSKDYIKNEFHSIYITIKTDVNNFSFHGEMKFHFGSHANTF